MILKDTNPIAKEERKRNISSFQNKVLVILANMIGGRGKGKRAPSFTSEKKYEIQYTRK